jgi:hypothetical protein
MGRELGRISGPLLADNLLRNGNDIAVETGLLYLNVSNGYVGINNAQPTKALDILGTTVAPTLIVDNQAKFGGIIFGDEPGSTPNQIQNLFDVINIIPEQTSPNIVVPGLGTDKLRFTGNTLSNYISGDNLIIGPTGQVVIGTVSANNNVLVNGALHATGDITFDGNIILGSGPTNTISIPAEVNSDIIPLEVDLTDELGNILTDESDLGLTQEAVYNLGSNSLFWNTIYSNTLTTGDIVNTNIVTGAMTIGNITIGANSITDNLIDDNMQFYVSGTGKINLNNTIAIQNNTITYNQNSPLNFNFTADSITGAQNGYLKFGGATGFVPPVGTTAQRPLNADIGTIRFNSDLSILEVFANVSNTVTSFDAVTNQTVSAGTSIIYTTSTAGMKVGDYVTGTSLPGAFSPNTLISSLNPGVSFSISNPLLLSLPSGSTVNALRQWVPSIGLSPVLSLEEVTETMDIWTLILG